MSIRIDGDGYVSTWLGQGERALNRFFVDSTSTVKDGCEQKHTKSWGRGRGGDPGFVHFTGKDGMHLMLCR